MKYIVKPAIILLAVTTVAATLLGVVESITAEPIEQANIKILNEAMQASLPQAATFEEAGVELEGTITAINVGKDESGEIVGFVITTNPSGFGGAVPTTVGIGTDGVITGISVTTPSETPGLGALAGDAKFVDQFTGKSGGVYVTQDGGEIQSITSATITSRAVAGGVNEALAWFEANGGAN